MEEKMERIFWSVADGRPSGNHLCQGQGRSGNLYGISTIIKAEDGKKEDQKITKIRENV